MYTTNKHLPRIRRDAALYALKYGYRKAQRHYGYSLGAISKWVNILKKNGIHPIQTKSSRPQSHPNELGEDIARKICATRQRIRRSSEVVHKVLREEGVEVSLSSVKRTLDRRGLLKKRSPWKRLHRSLPRPDITKPGDLVQVDTIHLITRESTRIYIFTLLDVYSRWSYAYCYPKATCKNAVDFLKKAQSQCLFSFSCIQSDNGSEFSQHFTERIDITHRHSRVRRPNDNAHLERFNRTLQEECVQYVSTTVSDINKALHEYLEYYNTKRHHFGLNLETPLSVIKCSQGID